MKLYHGTSGAALDRILALGVRPRGRKGRSNWKETVDSNPRCVYLTDSYAPYFAINARDRDDPQASCAVIEIDTDQLDPKQLLPDEDFLEQVGRHHDGIPGTMAERTRYYRRRQFTYTWQCRMMDDTRAPWWHASLKYLGTCSHRGTVPPEAITRAVSWPYRPNAWLGLVWDPQICLMNQRIAGDGYRSLTRKLIEGEFSTNAEMAAVPVIERFRNPLLPAIEGWRVVDLRQRRAA